MHDMAYTLHIPIQELREMPYEDLQGWIAYFKQRPPGWREDDRTFQLLRAFATGMGGKYDAKPYEVFPSLRPLYHKEPTVTEDGQIDVGNFKGSTLFNKLMSATDGVKLNVD